MTFEVKYYIMENNELHRYKIHITDITQTRNFTKKGDFLWNFSCPFCGDSQKNRKKVSEVLFTEQRMICSINVTNYSHGTNLSKLIEYIDPNTHKEYVMERYKEGSNGTPYRGVQNTRTRL